jgi:hypothetical protein
MTNSCSASDGTADEAADRLLDLALQHGAPDRVRLVSR